jgi:hypothetical protein
MQPRASLDIRIFHAILAVSAANFAEAFLRPTSLHYRSGKYKNFIPLFLKYLTLFSRINPINMQGWHES